MIKMIAGVFGLRVEKDGQKTRVIGKGPNDGPFSTTPEQEARLVSMGMAVYVNETAQQDQEQDEQVEVDTETPIGFDEIPPADGVEEDAEADPEQEAEEIVDLETLSAKDLRELGKEYGLSFKANAKKVDMIAAITAAQAELAEPAEDAPTFDASEAVL